MKVRGALLASAAGALVAPVANAADLGVKAPPVSPVVSWAGWYIGGNLGAAWQHGDNGVGGASSYSMNGTSFMGGAQIGYNWQHGHFVYGLEFDGSLLSKSVSQGHSYFQNSNTIEWLTTLRARMGLAVDDTMVYMTGGPALGGVKNELTFTSPSDPNKSSTKTRVGWAIGGGIEHMWDEHWTIGLEGLFVDLGRYGFSGYTGNCANSNGRTCPTSFSNQALIGRFKVNYRF